MKKLIALTALLSMSVAFAADDVVYGTFVLNSSESEIVLCVPWVNPGSDAAIPVKDLIQTSTLEVGDQLFYYDNGYKAWQVQEVEGKKVWVGATNVVRKDGTTINGGSDTETLKRGNAVVLKRVKKDGRSNNIVINGQFETNAADPMTMARGEGVVYSLIAPASPDKATKLNSGTWTNVQDNDVVIVNMKPYYCQNGKWGTRGKKLVYDENAGGLVYEWEESDVEIPAGQGAWFVAQGAADKETKWDPSAQ